MFSEDRKSCMLQKLESRKKQKKDNLLSLMRNLIRTSLGLVGLNTLTCAPMPGIASIFLLRISSTFLSPHFLGDYETSRRGSYLNPKVSKNMRYSQVTNSKVEPSHLWYIKQREERDGNDDDNAMTDPRDDDDQGAGGEEEWNWWRHKRQGGGRDRKVYIIIGYKISERKKW